MFNKKGGRVPEEYIELRNRISKLENKINKCECMNKFKKGDCVNFIYSNNLSGGQVVGKMDGDCYCIRSGEKTFAVPECQISLT